MAIVQNEGRSGSGARSITAKIRRAIEIGQYLDGDQLPPERELSESYKSSRSTIRKALDNLEAAGLVQRKVGSGTFVSYSGPKEIDVDSMIDTISPIHLIEARIGFERQMTRLAVVHATARDLEKMETIYHAMERTEDDKLEFTRLDSEFHLMLAQASGNPLIVQLYKQINEVRTHSQWQHAREMVLQPEKIKIYNQFHQQILANLKRRDVNGAIEALNGHMELAHQDLIRAKIGE